MHIKKIVVGVGIITLLVPVITMAAVFRGGEEVSIPQSERITGNAYIAGGSVSSAGSVSGDLIAGGGSVIVTSAVGQDLAAAGGNIIVSGAVGGDARVAGGNIAIQGRVAGDVIAAGGQIQLVGPSIGGDVLWAGGTLGVRAPVTGNLELAGAEVTIDSVVRGNVHFKGDKLTLGENAEIRGNLTYASPKEAVIAEGAIVRGETIYEPTKSGDAGKAAALISVGLLLSLLMTIAGAMLIGLVFKRLATTVVNAIADAPLQELGRGFAAMVLLPIASILLLVTVVGIPLGVLGLFLFGAFAILSCMLAAVVTGSLAYKWATGAATYEVTWLTILIGAAIYFVLGFIPLIGWIAKAILMFMAAGAIAKIHWGIAKEWR